MARVVEPSALAGIDIAEWLRTVLAGDADEPLELLSRERVLGGTHVKEIVRCRRGRETVTLLCKYDGHPDIHVALGHRRGVAYEAEVYERLLQSLTLTKPELLAVLRAGDGRPRAFAIQHLEGLHASKWPTPDGVLEAARWIGRFHAATKGLAETPSCSFLIRYDAPYYAGWARRTREFAAPLGHDLPWVSPLCRRVEGEVRKLFAGERTVVHGEYVSKNVLVSERGVFPIDWESAAVGLAEIDLATLTDGYEPAEAAEVEAAYVRARWGDRVPDTFRRSLLAARLYVQLRWLGDRPEWTVDPDVAWRFEALRAAAAAVGFRA